MPYQAIPVSLPYNPCNLLSMAPQNGGTPLVIPACRQPHQALFKTLYLFGTAPCIAGARCECTVSLQITQPKIGFSVHPKIGGNA